MTHDLLTMTPRGTDDWGSGEYLAPRGDHQHEGIDLLAWPGEKIGSVCIGRVTKIGFPYMPGEKGHFRYVEIEDRYAIKLRYFYVSPLVKLDDWVEIGQEIGTVQDIARFYPGMKNHIHFEIRHNGDHADPKQYLGIVGNERRAHGLA